MMVDWSRRISLRRYGGETGLNEMGNSGKMAGIITAPFLVGWLFVQMFVPVEYVDLGIMAIFGFWFAYCILIYAHAKSDANSYRAFPQPVFRYPDGGVRVYNCLLMPPDCQELVTEFKDGSKGYHVFWDQKVQYHQKGMPFPFIFNSGFWKVQKEWDKTFAHSSGGEFFHKGIAVNHPACESISVYVVGWHRNRDGEIEPVCVVNDCSHRYKEMLDKSMKLGSLKELGPVQKFKMLWEAERRTTMNLLEHEALLEETIDVMRLKAKDVKKMTDNTMGAIRDRSHTIMDTEESLLKRIFNFKNIMKFLIILTVICIIGHFFFGFP